MWPPAGPPKIPNSCCSETRSTLLEFRNSAARPGAVGKGDQREAQRAKEHGRHTVQTHFDHNEVHATSENHNQRGQQILGRHRRLREFYLKRVFGSDRKLGRSEIRSNAIRHCSGRFCKCVVQTHAIAHSDKAFSLYLPNKKRLRRDGRKRFVLLFPGACQPTCFGRFPSRHHSRPFPPPASCSGWPTVGDPMIRLNGRPNGIPPG